MKRLNFYPVYALLMGASLLAGCTAPEDETNQALPTTTGKVPPIPPPNLKGLDVGTDLVVSKDKDWLKKIVASKTYGNRPDPFALFPNEKQFETKQTAAMLFQTQGSFEPLFVPAVQVVEDVPVQYEVQPYRRLAGVLVGDSVSAIIEMGNGRPPEVIRPGQQIPGTEWRVISIDEEKAVLRRDGNVLPKEVIVRLESRPANQQPQNRPGGLQRPGAPPGFRPGFNEDYPGGFPGGNPDNYPGGMPAGDDY